MSTKVTKRRGPGRPPGSKNRVKPKKLARKGYKINNKPVKAIPKSVTPDALALKAKALERRTWLPKGTEVIAEQGARRTRAVILDIDRGDIYGPYLVIYENGFTAHLHRKRLKPTGKSLRTERVRSTTGSFYLAESINHVAITASTISISGLSILCGESIRLGNIKRENVAFFRTELN